MIKLKPTSILPVLAWSFYDLANQFFALNVISLHFPRWISVEKGAPEIYFSLSFGISMFMVALCAPFLGMISDMKNWRRLFLGLFTIVAVIFTIAMGFAKGIFLPLVLFAIANFGCQEAVVFYNALLTRVAPREKVGLVSGFGMMLGYIGAIVALLFTKPVIVEMGYKGTFIFTGIFFFLFALPCLIFVRDEKPPEKMELSFFLKKSSLQEIYAKFRETLTEAEHFKGLKHLLKASFFLLCFVNAIILFMSVYAVKVFGLKEGQIIDLMAFSAFFAVLGSILSGYLSDIVGYGRSLVAIFLMWACCIITGGLLGPPWHWLVGALAGTCIGSTWVVLRAMVVRLVPREKVGEAFGLFNLVSYFSGIAGPVFFGVMLFFFSRLGVAGYRISFMSMLIFMIGGLYFLLSKKPEKTREVF
ncbi:MAG: MFS transporter [Candidatus Omnitrophica bacterium]|nr:MFS transporter [Candidatus Omnitrophota bacterium]